MATTKLIQSLERAFSILELFQNRDELSLKEITESVGLNKSTTFGLVNSLCLLGYLYQNSDNQKYSLGVKVLSLTNAMRRNNILIRVARPYLEKLSAKYQETVHSAIAFNHAVVYLDKVEAISSIYINTQIGTRNYMHCTGVGKCLLAYKSTEEIDAILNSKLKAMTYNTITNPEKLKHELEKIRINGYAEDNEEIEIGLSCLSVPIFSGKDQPGFAISLSGPTTRIQLMNKKIVIADLKKSAASLSQLIYSYTPEYY